MIMKYLLSLIVILLLFVASCSLFEIEETPEIPAGFSAESLEAEQYISCIEDCKSCETNCHDTIYYTKATQDQNANFCESIMSSTLQSECKETILAEEAIAQLNKEKCLQLTEEAAQNTCLVHVAAEVAVQSNSVAKCLEAVDVDRCQAIFYKDMAVANNDVSYCDKLENEEQKTHCYDVVQ